MRNSNLDYIIENEINKLKKNLLKEFNSQDGGFYSDEVQSKIDKANKRDGQELSSDAETLRNILLSPYLDIKQFAIKVYPDHTEEGAQSQLNKILRGDTTDSGKPYVMKERVARELRKCLSELYNSIGAVVNAKKKSIGTSKHNKNLRKQADKKSLKQQK